MYAFSIRGIFFKYICIAMVIFSYLHKLSKNIHNEASIQKDTGNICNKKYPLFDRCALFFYFLSIRYFFIISDL